LKTRVNYFEEVDKSVNIGTLVKEKINFQKTYRTLTKLNLEKRLLIDG